MVCHPCNKGRNGTGCSGQLYRPSSRLYQRDDRGRASPQRRPATLHVRQGGSKWRGTALSQGLGDALQLATPSTEQDGPRASTRMPDHLRCTAGTGAVEASE
ncbi:hypothetical protein MRX96_057903 [Rhipicephalus microplus]